MANHYHLLIQTPEGNLSRAMRNINGVYTQRFNRKHGHDGKIFRGRYKSILVDADNYLLALVRYIHRNPVRAGIVKKVEDHPWSSHEAYTSSSSKWQWIHKEMVLSLLSRDRKRVYGEYRKFVSQEDTDELTDFYKKKNLSSVLGSKEFVNWVREKFSELLFKEEILDAKKLAPDVDMIK